MSAVITCYNYRDFVGGAIESALGQTRAYHEIVVVDDGSSDGSLDEIRKFGNRVQVVEKRNGGHLDACRAGLEHVTGDYVHFLDADDRALPEFVEAVTPLLARTPVKVQCQLQVIDATGTPTGSVYPTFAQDYSAEAMREDNETLGFYQCTPTSGNVFAVDALRRLDLEALSPRSALDGAICLAMPYLGEVISINAPLAQYGVHGASLSNSHSAPSVEQCHKELAEFDRNWHEACQLLNLAAPPFGNHRPLYVRERLLLIRALRGGAIAPLLPGYLRCLRNSHLTPRQKALQSAWVTSLTVPSQAWRSRAIELRRSGSGRPAWMKRAVSAMRAGTPTTSIQHVARTGTSTRPVRSIAILTAVNPFPTDSGKAIVLAGFLKHLLSRVPADHIHYLHVGRPIEDLDPFQGIDVIELGSPTRAEQLVAIAKDAFIRRRSLQETFTASPSIAARVRQVIEELQPDLEIVDTVRMAQFTDFPPVSRRVIYFDDLFSVRYQRMLDLLNQGDVTADFDPLGQFGQFIPGPLHGLTSATITRKMLLRLESSRVERTEKRVAKDPHNEMALLLNDAESERLQGLTGAAVETLPVLIKQPDPEALKHEWSGTPDFIFMGLLSIAHNHDALLNYLREGLPRQLELAPESILHIVGRDADDEIREAASSFGDRVRFHGFVPDLEEVVTTKCALVNPLRFGSGVKIKTLDALSRAVPVVATSFGAEGVSSVSRPGLTIVPDARSAAEQLVALLDPAVHAEASDDAIKLFTEKFSPAAVAQKYDAVFGTRPPGEEGE